MPPGLVITSMNATNASFDSLNQGTPTTVTSEGGPFDRFTLTVVIGCSVAVVVIALGLIGLMVKRRNQSDVFDVYSDVYDTDVYESLPVKEEWPPAVPSESIETDP